MEQHEEALHNHGALHLMIENSNHEKIGYAILRGLNDQNRNIKLIRIVITDKGCGHGKHALQLIKKWCFETQKAHHLWLDVLEENIRAQHVYETQGFMREGVLRECVKTGETYHSLVVLSVLEQDYFR